MRAQIHLPLQIAPGLCVSQVLQTVAFIYHHHPTAAAAAAAVSRENTAVVAAVMVVVVVVVVVPPLAFICTRGAHTHTHTHTHTPRQQQRLRDNRVEQGRESLIASTDGAGGLAGQRVSEVRCHLL